MADALLAALDTATAVLTVLVAIAFARVWAASRDALHLLFVLGFFLLGLSFLLTGPLLGAPSESTPALLLRLSGAVAGVLLIAFGYLTDRRHGSARLGLAFLWTVLTGLVLVTVVYVISLPETDLPSVRSVRLVGNLVSAGAFLLCGGLASLRIPRPVRRERILVPVAFLALAAENIAWISVAMSPGATSPLPYLGRLAAVALLLAAVGLPAARDGSATAEAPT